MQLVKIKSYAVFRPWPDDQLPFHLPVATFKLPIGFCYIICA